MTVAELIQEYQIVVRPSLLRYTGKFCAAMFRRIYLDGGRIDVWPQTHVEADTLEAAVIACAEKCKKFTASEEYMKAISY